MVELLDSCGDTYVTALAMSEIRKKKYPCFHTAYILTSKQVPIGVEKITKNSKVT